MAKRGGRPWGEKAFAQPLGQAAEACLLVVDASLRANQPLQATDAWLQAAACYTQTHQPHKAADGCLEAAARYRQTDQPEMVVEVCLKAVDAYQRAGQPGLAADAARAHAEARPQEERYRRAAAAYGQAAKLYADRGQHGPAGDA